MADNTHGDTLQVHKDEGIIQKRRRPALGTLAGDLTFTPGKRFIWPALILCPVLGRIYPVFAAG
jgi:hypothetical protein